MTPYVFKGYGPGAPKVAVVLECITHWVAQNYNGKDATEIHLNSGISVLVGDSAETVFYAVLEHKAKKW